MGSPGINLRTLSGADTTTSGTEAAGNGDNYVYNVDVSSGETITLTGNWSNDLAAEDGQNDNGNGQYSATNQPSFGTFTLNSANGAMSWSFTYDQLLANGGLSQAIVFTVTGQDYEGGFDTDTVTVNITCFVTGTRIATPAGEVAVQDLAIGDLVLTADGRAVPVRWIGQNHIRNSVLLADRKLPVCISAGALAAGVPHSDLYLSADHGMIVDGLVVNAGALVNGGSIRFVPMAEMPAEFTYYHIETEAHDEILANGAAAETFVDYIGRKDFDNYAEYVTLYGCDRIIPEMRRTRISAQRQLPQTLRDRLGLPAFAAQAEADYHALMARLMAA